MNKEVIIYRIIDRCEIKNILAELSEAGIRYKEKINNNKIETENVIIKLVNVPISKRNIFYVKGMRAVGCYGLDVEAEDYLTRGHNVCKGYSLVEYILRRNK